MKAQKKAEREQQKLLAYLARAGKDTSQLELEAPVHQEAFNQDHLDGQAVLAYWESGRTFQDKTCRTCNRTFSTNYNSVDTCSMKCLRVAVEKIGIKWHPEKPAHERWGRTPPLLVPPEALIVLNELKEFQEIKDDEF